MILAAAHRTAPPDPPLRSQLTKTVRALNLPIRSLQSLSAFRVKKISGGSISLGVGRSCRQLCWVLLLSAGLAAADNRLHLKSRKGEFVEDLHGHLAAPPKRRAGSRAHLLLQFRRPPDATVL